MEQTAVGLVLSAFIWLKTNFLVPKVELRTCSFSSRRMVHYRQIKTPAKGKNKSSFMATCLSLQIWWASKRSSPPQGRVSFAALATPGMVQGMLVAEREFAILASYRVHLLQLQKGISETERYSRFNSSCPDGVHVLLPQASRKKTRDHLLYGTNQ